MQIYTEKSRKAKRLYENESCEKFWSRSVCHSSSIIIILLETSSIQLDSSSQVASFVGNSALFIPFIIYIAFIQILHFMYAPFASLFHDKSTRRVLHQYHISSGFKFRPSLNFSSVDGETVVLHSEDYKFL